MVITHILAKNQGQRSVGLKDTVKTNSQMDMTDRNILPTNVVGKQTQALASYQFILPKTLNGFLSLSIDELAFMQFFRFLFIALLSVHAIHPPHVMYITMTIIFFSGLVFPYFSLLCADVNCDFVLILIVYCVILILILYYNTTYYYVLFHWRCMYV